MNVRIRLHNTIVAALLASLIVGCANEDASEISFRIAADVDSLTAVHIHLRDNVAVSQFRLDDATTYVGPFGTSRSGDLTVEFRLLADGNATETTGSVKLPVREDWGWGVTFHASTQDPTEMCFGCFGSSVFDLDPALGYEPDEKLYVVWGGNSITNPADY